MRPPRKKKEKEKKIKNQCGGRSREKSFFYPTKINGDFHLDSLLPKEWTGAKKLDRLIN